MSAVNNPTTTLGEWYPPLCPHQKPPQCTGQYQFYRFADQNVHAHENACHIKIVALRTTYRIHVAVSFALRNEAVWLGNRIEAVLHGKPWGKDTPETIETISQWSRNPARDYTLREETIDCDAEVTDLMQPFLWMDELLPPLPTVVNAIVLSYFGDLLPTLFQALYEGRYRHMIHVEQDKWALPALPLVKEALTK